MSLRKKIKRNCFIKSGNSPISSCSLKSYSKGPSCPPLISCIDFQGSSGQTKISLPSSILKATASFIYFLSYPLVFVDNIL